MVDRFHLDRLITNRQRRDKRGITGGTEHNNFWHIGSERIRGSGKRSELYKTGTRRVDGPEKAVGSDKHHGRVEGPDLGLGTGLCCCSREPSRSIAVIFHREVPPASTTKGREDVIIGVPAPSYTVTLRRASAAGLYTWRGYSNSRRLKNRIGEVPVNCARPDCRACGTSVVRNSLE